MMPLSVTAARLSLSRGASASLRCVGGSAAGNALSCAISRTATKGYPRNHTVIVRLLSFSRMLDMGGAPSAANDRTLIRTVNASKNSKLQAVAFDFEILIRRSGSSGSSKSTASQQAATNTSTTKLNTRPHADTERINQMASLLNVDMDSNQTFKNPYKEQIQSASSLSAKLLGQTSSNDTPTPPAEAPLSSPDFSPSSSSSNNNPLEDIRAKYAKKLKGGLAGIELAKSQVEDSLSKGDAAGHLAARKIAMKQPTTTQSNRSGKATKWMANFGASKLLTYLTHRSIRIALLPSPSHVGDALRQEQEQDHMQDLATQLKDVVIDVTVPSLMEKDGAAIVTSLKKNVLQEFGMDPGSVLLVSDRDDYLRAAKEVGMMTCRLQPKNARRGNITAHYTSPSVEEVQEVVNEINGISFNAVLNR